MNMETNKPETEDLESEPLYWLDNPRHVNWLCYGLYVACALLFGLDLFGLYEKHAHFDFENWIGFFGFFLLPLVNFWPFFIAPEFTGAQTIELMN